MLAISKATDQVIGQVCNPRPGQPAGTLCVLTGAGAGTLYVDVLTAAVKLESVR